LQEELKAMTQNYLRVRGERDHYKQQLMKNQSLVDNTSKILG